MRKDESRLQQSCVRWFRYSYPLLGKLLFAVPNEGKRSVATASRMKAEGMVSGVADLFLCVPKIVNSKIYHGLFIEMKMPGNKQTENQKAFQVDVIGQGYDYYLCYSFDDFEQYVSSYLKGHGL